MFINFYHRLQSVVNFDIRPTVNSHIFFLFIYAVAPVTLLALKLR